MNVVYTLNDMFTLGLNIAVKPYSISIVSNETRTLLASLSVSSGYAFSENIMIDIQSLLQRINLDWKSLSCVGVPVGPGPYTGVRLGITFSKTIGQVLSVPVYSFSSMDLLISDRCYPKGLVLALLPARKSEYNIAIYASNGQVCSKICEESLFSEKELLMFLKYYPSDRVIVCLDSDRSNLVQLLGDQVRVINQRIDSFDLGSLALAAFLSGRKGEGKGLVPRYSHSPFVGPLVCAK